MRSYYAGQSQDSRRYCLAAGMEGAVLPVSSKHVEELNDSSSLARMIAPFLCAVSIQRPSIGWPHPNASLPHVRASSAALPPENSRLNTSCKGKPPDAQFEATEKKGH
ncbi:hypothetical protein G7K_3553-t1 [Saitoella complicata NRRL Y-17804]|uniref:Uncharacterized protein n=1 Tax=Saitoella complicata (strain BCRC 22490 / CBS 7301 / JCM 7358 / NBRC 10748 / NRRL Y-17804) TaxID=698492 RepID=A0A0E9NHX4_SAICN|nr:hypothetical protein G7K_3553-t1 [Saitoella complicata NRRL Y-17804]